MFSLNWHTAACGLAAKAGLPLEEVSRLPIEEGQRPAGALRNQRSNK
jgi:hypothetical protein